MKVKTYNHLLDIGFEVPDSLFKNADDCLRSERNKVIRAILRRLEAIMQEDDFTESIGHCDTSESGGGDA